MGEIRIKNAPEELRQLLKAEAKRLGVDVRAVILFRLWGAASAPHTGAARDPLETPRGPEKTPSGPRAKFTEPTDEQMDAEYRAKGYHFDLPTFKAHYRANGWKVGKNPMKDWKQALVGWESRWNERWQTGGSHGGEQGRQLSATEARVERSKRNIIEGLTAPAGDRTAPDRTEREVGTPKRIGD